MESGCITVSAAQHHIQEEWSRERSVLLYVASMQWECVLSSVSSLHSLSKSFRITAASCVGFPLQIWSLEHKNVGVAKGLKVKTLPN